MPIDIIGDELDIIGADVGQLTRPGGARGREAAQDSGYRSRAYSRQSFLMLGFDSGATIAAGASANIQNTPQLPFKPVRLSVPSSLADSFVVTSLTIGLNPQFAATGNVPAAAFVPTAEGIDLELDTAQPQQAIVVGVTNISGGAARFLAALFGIALKA